MMAIKEDWLQWFKKFFDKKSKGSGVYVEVKPSKQLAEELHKLHSLFWIQKQYLGC